MKKILLLFCFAAITSFGFSQAKIFSGGNAVLGDNTPGSPPKQLQVNEGVTSLNIGKSTAGAAGTLNIVDITPGFNGNLRIGSWDTASNTAGGAALQAWASSTAFKGAFFFDAGNVAGSSINYRFGSSTKMKILQNGNVGIGVLNPTQALDVAGNIKATGTVMGSDIRIKKSLSDFEGGLDKVLKLNPVNFTYNGKGGSVDGSTHIGLVAQELQKIAPEFVSEFKHMEVQEADYENYYKSLKEETYLQIKDNEIKYLLVNAIQEQQKMIEDQNERIAVLEDVINTIGSTESNNNTNITLSSYDLAELDQNVPNPFSASTTISYVIPTDASNAQIGIFGQNGQLMRSIDIDHVGQGTLNVNAENLPSGTYSYQLIVEGRNIQSKKFVVTK